MKRLNTLFHIIKVTGFNQFLTSFVSFIFISGGILLLVEPQISNYWDGLWYSVNENYSIQRLFVNCSG